MNSRNSQGASPWLMALLIAVVGFAVHSRCLQIGFMSDDYDLIYALDRAKRSLLDPYPAGRGTYFRPAVMATLGMERALSKDPLLHHVVNLLIHLTNGLLVFVICLLASRRPPLAATLALLFLLHRANVANVYWISARAESLATLGALAAIFAAVLPARLTIASQLLVVVGTLLALLAKESAIALPLILLLVALARSRFAAGEDRGSPEAKAPFRLAALSGAICAVFAVYLAARFYADSGTSLASVGSIITGLVRGFLLLTLPISEWDLYRLDPGPIPAVLLSALFLLAAVWAIFRQAQRTVPAALFLLPVAAYLPVLLLQGGGSARLLYMPVAACCVAIAFSPCSALWIRVLMVLTIVMGLGSIVAGSDWLANWRLMEACCRDYRLFATQGEAHLLVVPRQIGEAPVFSNDARSALFYCQFRRPGYLRTPPPVAEAVFAGRYGVRSLRRGRDDHGEVLRGLASKDGWFVFPAVREGEPRRDEWIGIPQGTIKLRGPSVGAGSATEFLFRPNALPAARPRLLLDFNGRGLEVVTDVTRVARPE